jgi:hypothetical protein
MTVRAMGTLNTRLEDDHIADARLTVDREALRLGTSSPGLGMPKV